MHQCKGEAAVIIDADLQDPPEVIRDSSKTGMRVMRSFMPSAPNAERAVLKGFAHLFYLIMSHITEIEMTVDAGDSLDRPQSD